MAQTYIDSGENIKQQSQSGVLQIIGDIPTVGLGPEIASSKGVYKLPKNGSISAIVPCVTGTRIELRLTNATSATNVTVASLSAKFRTV